MPDTNVDVDDALTALEAAMTKLGTDIDTIGASTKQVVTDASSLITAMTSAFSRLLQKIAAGAPDLTPEVTRINALLATVQSKDTAVLSSNTALTTSDGNIVGAIAQANVEGN